VNNFFNKFLKATITITALALPMAVEQREARADFHSCQAEEVIELDNRVSVRCTNSIMLNGNVVVYVAIAKTDVARTGRFISLAQAALLSGRPFFVDLPVSSTSNVTGCAATDCRTPLFFGLKK
jgi:hypothetical protein